MQYSKRTTKVFDFIQGLSDVEQDCLMQDVPRWARIRKTPSDDSAFLYAFETRQEFRSVVRFRAWYLDKYCEMPAALAYLKTLPQALYVTNLYLSTKDIGPGLYLEHAFSTIVFARRIGRNAHINQNVTIGAGKNGIPEIGDNVDIRAGAIVIGGIRIGDNVKIGAGAVVVEDVPDGAVALSPKARIILPD